MQKSMVHWQVISFFAALFVYAVFGSPTPDSFGFAEILTGLLLVLSIRIEPIRLQFLNIGVLVFGLSVPIMVGVIRGNAIPDQMRDIIPFLFLVLPVLYGWILRLHHHAFLYAVASIGFIFSMRTIWAYRDVVMMPSLWGQGAPADLLYLANSPEVLFSALFCLAMGSDYILRRAKPFKGFAVLLASIIPVVAMGLMMQRAGLGSFFLGAVIAMGIAVYVRPVPSILFGCVFGGVLWAVYPVIEPIFLTLWQKTELVGLNSRAQEWEAVFDILQRDWSVMLFGEGWGGRLYNPAVGGLNVNYTHSLLSSLMLKTGVLGVVLIGLVVAIPVFRGLYAMFIDKNVRFMMIIAFLAPLFIAGFLYASYKSLGFGLILLAVSGFLSRKLVKNASSVP